MKLKVSLQRAGGDQKDLLVTADAVTTVGTSAGTSSSPTPPSGSYQAHRTGSSRSG